MRISGSIAAVVAALVTTPAFAQPVVVADSGDSAWVLAASILGLIAILPGLAMFYGRGRAGPTGFALFGGVAVASLLFAVIGYSIAFGDGSPYLGGAGNAMLGNLSELVDGLTISEPVYVVFETMLALFAVGILCASLGENARPAWLIPFAGIWMLIVYVPVARWVWAGWLGDLGVIDYAGALPVQIAGGVAALAVAFLMRAPSSTEIQHDSRLAVTGAALLWVGFLALMGAAALGGSDDAATAIINGHLAASAAVVTGMAVERFTHGRVSVYGVANNAVTGLAAVTAGAGLVGAGGAMALGALGAVAATLAGMLVSRAKLGSTAAAFSIHGAPALVGAVLLPVFLLPVLGGPGFDEGSGLVAQLAAQGIAVLAVMLWTAVATVIAALLVSTVAPIRLAKVSRPS
ncbi:ammonium transporter [Sphingomonas sp. SUN039]|uniref:ammonium transporter n=1 Tax=Sphingomonas sp. SUN039 TaxID=2937787 RepID=UPI002164645B|nr:ammonium transporter [Sphingomonas sp. SUN039]UVO53946.1 ammonium transporter [Sphingomonas sp. SUN039]